MVDQTSKSSSTTLEAAETNVDAVSQNNTETDQTVNPVDDSPDTMEANGSSAHVSDQISAVEERPATPPLPQTESPPSKEAKNNMTESTTSAEEVETTASTHTETNVSAIYGNYEDYQLMPTAPWPPPVFVRQDISPQERYYMEHRWYSQWTFFDSKAKENKNRYYRTQLIVGIGSVTVPVLVGINAEGVPGSVLYFVTVFVSLAVALSTAIESLYTFGENWRSYRSAAEDLRQEKSLYDVKAGRYADNPQAFIRFVERCEEIIAQQNGRWIQSQEKAAEQVKDQTDELLTSFGNTVGVDEFGNRITTTTASVKPGQAQYTPPTGTDYDATQVPVKSYNDTDTAANASAPTSYG